MVASSCCCVARWLATSMASEAAIASASRFRPSTRVSSWRRSSDLLRASAKDSARSTSAGFRPEGDQQQLNQGRRWSYPRSAHGHLLRGHTRNDLRLILLPPLAPNGWLAARPWQWWYRHSHRLRQGSGRHCRRIPRHRAPRLFSGEPVHQ